MEIILKGRSRLSQRARAPLWKLIGCSLIIYCICPTANAIHHMSRKPPRNLKRQYAAIPLTIRNLCTESIFPGINTQSGTGPSETGFELWPGSEETKWVSGDWQGRVWGRTNCSFNSAGTGPSGHGGGKACGTGDCNGLLNCMVTVGLVARQTALLILNH
jgi:hypothetical protein